MPSPSVKFELPLTVVKSKRNALTNPTVNSSIPVAPFLIT